jgi:hypothetical protein
LPPSFTTELASGHITRAHELSVVLQESEGNPPIVLIGWPDQPSITTPHQLQATVAKATTILAKAVIALARIRKDRRL